MNVSENLKAYLDGELTPEETKTVETALTKDPALRAELEELRALTTTIQSMARQPQAKGFDQTKASVLAGPKSSWPVMVRTFGVVAAVTVFAALLFPVFAPAKDAAKTADQSEMSATAASTEAPASAGFAEADMAQRAKTESLPGDEISPSNQAPGRDRAPAESFKANEDQGLRRNPASSSVDSSLPRQIIKTAYLTVKVDDVQSLEPQVRDLAKKYGGFIESSSGRHPVQNNSVRTAEFTLRVKVEHFETAFDQLAALGVVLDQSVDGKDVTAAIVDTEARLRTKRAEETQYRELLKTTKKVSEILEVRERLYDVREEIESLDAQAKSLKDHAALSTIHLTLQERPKTDPPAPQIGWQGETVTHAVNLLRGIGRLIGQALIYLGVLTPVWLPLLALNLYRTRRQ